MKTPALPCIALCLCLMFSLAGYGQSPIHKEPIINRLDVNGGNFLYKGELRYQLTDCGYGDDPSAVNIGFAEILITDITYGGYNATDLLDDVTYPIAARLQANVTGTVILRKGSLSYTAGFSQAWVANTGFQSSCFSDTDKRGIKTTFGEDITHPDLMASMSTLNISQEAAVESKASSIIDRMKSKIREVEKKEREEEQEKVRQEKEAKAERERETNSYSSSSNSNTSSSYNNSSTSYNSSNSESEQERRDREYNERKRAFEKEQLAKLNRSTQAYEQRQANLTKAGNNILNAIDNMQQQASARRAREAAAEEERYRQIRAEKEAEKARKAFEANEERLRKEREREEKEAKRKHKVYIEDAQTEFIGNLKNQEIPVQVSVNEVFFFMVDAERYPKPSIKFAPFKVLANESNQIPYRVDILNDFMRKSGEYGYKIYGPYNSKFEQQSAMDKMTADAERIEMFKEADIMYHYVQKNTTTTSNSSTDFWGNKRKSKTDSSTTKKKKSTSFWDEN